MPDFLNKDAKPTGPAEPIKPQPLFGRVPSRRPGQSATPVASSPLLSNQQEGDAPEAAPKDAPKKAPSRLITEYYAAVFLLLVAVFIAIGYLVLRPLVNDYKMLNANIASSSALLKDERGYLDSLQRSIAAAQSIPEQTLADVDEALPRATGIPKLLQMLAQIAVSNGVRLGSLQFSSPKPSSDAQVPAPSVPVDGGASSAGSVAAVDIGMSIASPGYASTRRFLDALERNMRLFDVQTIAVSANEQTSDQSYTIQLRTYTLAPAVSQAPTP